MHVEVQSHYNIIVFVSNLNIKSGGPSRKIHMAEGACVRWSGADDTVVQPSPTLAFDCRRTRLRHATGVLSELRKLALACVTSNGFRCIY